jgi:hypothetical protein
LYEARREKQTDQEAVYATKCNDDDVEKFIAEREDAQSPPPLLPKC